MKECHSFYQCKNSEDIGSQKKRKKKKQEIETKIENAKWFFFEKLVNCKQFIGKFSYPSQH